MKKLKVLFLTNVPSPYRVDFFNELGKICDLTVTFDEKNDGNEWKIRNDKWFDKNFENFTGIYCEHKKIINKNYSIDPIKLINRNQYDIIIIGEYSSLTSIVTMRYMKKNRIEFFINSDGGFPKKNEFWLKKMIKTFLIKQADYYLTSGNNGTKYLEYYGAKKECIYTYTFSSFLKKDMPNRLLTPKEKEDIKNRLGILEKNVVLFIGQIIKRKGIDLLIKALQNMDENVGTYIIGGECTKEYKEMLKQYKIKNIHFINFLSKEELKDYLKISDVFAFPTREDIWGFAVTEALSYGIPVITTDKCGAGLDLIKNEYNGFIIDSDDSEKLKEKILYLIKNKKVKDILSKNAFNSMKNFVIENEVKEHMDIFEKFAQKRRKNFESVNNNTYI